MANATEKVPLGAQGLLLAILALPVVGIFAWFGQADKAENAWVFVTIIAIICGYVASLEFEYGSGSDSHSHGRTYPAPSLSSLEWQKLRGRCRGTTSFLDFAIVYGFVHLGEKLSTKTENPTNCIATRL